MNMSILPAIEGSLQKTMDNLHCGYHINLIAFTKRNEIFCKLFLI